MVDSNLTRRYATALYHIAVKRGVLPRVSADVNLLRDVILENPRLLDALESPGAPPQKKKDVLQSLFREQMDPLTLQFCDLLIEHRRTAVLQNLQPVFQKLADEAAGIIRARVETAIPMSAEQEQQMRLRLSQLTGKNVIVTSSVDRSIRGGAVVWLGDRVIDGSVRGYLDEVQQRII